MVCLIVAATANASGHALSLDRAPSRAASVGLRAGPRVAAGLRAAQGADAADRSHFERAECGVIDHVLEGTAEAGRADDLDAASACIAIAIECVERV